MVNVHKHFEVQQIDGRRMPRQFRSETSYMPHFPHLYSTSPFYEGMRLRAIDTMLQHFVNSYEDYNPLMPIRALGAFDRFISRPGNPDLDDSVIVNCIGLLAKHDRNRGFRNWGAFTQSLTSSEFILLYDEDVGERMIEYPWAFPFLDFFISLFNISQPEDHQVKTLLKQVAVLYYLPFMYLDISFSRFRPSTLAATALLSAIDATGNIQYHRFYWAIKSYRHVRKAELDRCLAKLLGKRIRQLLSFETVLPILNLPDHI